MPQEKRREKWLKHKFGMTYEDYRSLYVKQNESCKICKIKIDITSTDNSHKTACVDHDHKTGQVRGLLCNHCNRALGLMREDKGSIQRMLEYL